MELTRVVKIPYFWMIFALQLIYEIFISSIQVLQMTISTKSKFSSGYITFKTNLQSKYKISILLHVITMTPGTISVSSDGKNITIHALDNSDEEAVILSIRNGLENCISKLW
ncbi:Na+/H+ antiporter subunit E [Candidatus Gromoviella agglomerans]|uniref:Na+/H+ antiporter subunit E n=1 Tax=Candidatus Gromoviella agglomerans TaxID=2806609 RepID=UPI001E34C942|nr:Na+/H+ antiporter subunit E [Candidatus Gromoviella agglomerans]UFX98435.1 Putative MnhE-like Na(+)/H(+) antiporter subunit E [Candidatus Gromoviella agglomerans]